MLHCEELSNDGAIVTLFVETRRTGVPLPSDKFIEATFKGVAPEMSVEIKHRDDQRNCGVICVPAALHPEKRKVFLSRIGNMSGC
jgi:hypothetical protein